MSYSSARLGRCTTTSTPWVGAPRPPHLINFPPHRAIPKTPPGAMSCSYHGPAIMSSPSHAVSAVQSLPSCPVRNHVVLCPDPVCTMCSSPRRTFSNRVLSETTSLPAFVFDQPAVCSFVCLAVCDSVIVVSSCRACIPERVCPFGAFKHMYMYVFVYIRWDREVPRDTWLRAISYRGAP